MSEGQARIRSRRELVSACAVIGLAIATLAALEAWGEVPTRDHLSSTAVLVTDGEPGEPLIVTGVVYGPDGTSPRPGVKIHVYNTDAEGYYSRGGADEDEHRIRGDLVTDENGRYEIRTIRPGSYPGNRIPAHIHFVLAEDGKRERRLELQFQDDPLISDGRKRAAKARGRFGSIQMPVRVDEGALRCSFDIALD